MTTKTLEDILLNTEGRFTAAAAGSSDGDGRRLTIPLDLLESARSTIATALAAELQLPASSINMICRLLTRPRTKKNSGAADLTLPVAPIRQAKGWTVSETPSALMAILQRLLADKDSDVSTCVEAVQPIHDGAFLAITLRVSYTAQILHAILKGNYLDPLPPQHHQDDETTNKKVMIEYSQPNTHKAFHVGHMRNVALGDCLVRLYEQCGYDVVAANYYGDEGAHVAKCLWRLQQELTSGGPNEKDLTSLDIPLDQRGEFLGRMYAEAVEMLSLTALTSYPCLHAIAARVLTKVPHPSKPKDWQVCTLDIGPQGSHVTVVCAGTDFGVGDLVAYMPVGSTFKKKEVLPTDMLGVESTGMLLSYSEVGVTMNGPEAKPEMKKNANEQEKINRPICLIANPDAQVGSVLTELSRFPDLNESSDESVVEIFVRRQKEASDILIALESGDPKWCALWETTKGWSIGEFKKIYEWVGARFDVDFFESHVSEPSMKLVQECLDRGQVFEYREGAIGVNLDDYKLPFLNVVKSSGSGLYAAKDLALAQQKFQDFQIDRSIYVVDKGQQQHFQQVFATLDRMGFSNAKSSFHLAYGQVVRPEGQMSSRNGNVIYFSALQQALREAINREFLDKYKNDDSWTSEELQHANRAIAVGTIRYGMLNVDPDKDITFVLKKWIAKKGNTGPYLMYAYTRIQSILRNAAEDPVPECLSDDFPLLLNSTNDRSLLVQMSQFWRTVINATLTGKPNGLCQYLYLLAQEFMSWYEVSPILRAESKQLKKARLVLVEAIAAVLKSGLNLLGITTLDQM